MRRDRNPLYFATVALAAGVLWCGTAAAGTIVLGINQTSSAGADSSQIKQYATGGSFLGNIAGPPDVVDPTAFGEDTAGNLYVSSQDNQSIVRITPGGAVSTFKSGVSALLGMTVGPDNGVYFTQTAGGSTVKRINQNGTIDTVVSGIVAPRALAFSAAGDMYYTSNADIYKFDFGTSTSALFASLSTGVIDMTFDSLGNLLVTEGSANRVESIDSAGVVSIFADAGDGISNPFGIAVDEAGLVYVANSGAGTVRRFQADGSPVGSGDFVTGLVAPFPLGYWRATELAPPAVATPEPGTILLSLGGIGFLVARRRRAARHRPTTA